jgi:hypothetical protein
VRECEGTEKRAEKSRLVFSKQRKEGASACQSPTNRCSLRCSVFVLVVVVVVSSVSASESPPPEEQLSLLFASLDPALLSIRHAPQREEHRWHQRRTHNASCKFSKMCAVCAEMCASCMQVAEENELQEAFPAIETSSK